MTPNFEKAFEKTMRHEGGYSNDAVDPGGETYMGIARKREPGCDWKGWKVIDSYENISEISDIDRKLLRTYAKEFYFEEFWLKSKAHLIDSQAIAEEIFDTCVNTGVGRGIRILQKSLNLLNRDQNSWKDIKVDGFWGDNTLTAVGACLHSSAEDEWYLLMTMNMVQGVHYYKIVSKYPKLERFWRGWLKRAQSKGHIKPKLMEIK